MTHTKTRPFFFILTLTFTLVSLGSSVSQADVPSPEELSRRIDLLAGELETLRLGEVAAKADQKQFGLGPAASKVYRNKQGVSIGGYGELVYQNFNSKRDSGAEVAPQDQINFQRLVMYFGYKFSDKLILNTELEFEHASSAGNRAGQNGSWGLEFAYIDYQWDPRLSLRAGNLLVPMGWINELHEPTVFLGVRRPDVEQTILPSTWRENGVGIYGDWQSLTYRSYLLNGFDAGSCRASSCGNGGFDASGIRGGRQNGSRALSEDLAWVSRVDWTPVAGATLGGSYYRGDAGQDQTTESIPDLPIQIAELHFEYRLKGWELRGLGASTWIKNGAAFNAARDPVLTGASSIGSRQYGFYGQLGRTFGVESGSPWIKTPFVRYEQWDTQAQVPNGYSRDPGRQQRSLTLGVQFKTQDQLVLTAEFQNFANAANTGLDQVNLGMGFIF
jgi:hypothetical protein